MTQHLDLSEHEAAVLAFEEHAPRAVGAKEAAIREQFGLTPVAYYQRLNELLDKPAAAAAYPLLVSRLRRIRDRRDEQRRAARP